MSYISALNVADYGAIAATRKYADKNAVLEIGGPEPLSQLNVVAIFGKALNQKFKVGHVPMETLQTQHQSSDPLQKTFGALTLAYSKGDVVEGAVSIAQQHGIVLRSVADYATGLRTETMGIVA